MLNNASCFKRVFIATGYSDLRRGLEGLANIIRFQFHLDPYDKDMSIYLVMKQLQLLSAQDMGDLWCMKYLRVRCTMTVMNSFNL